MMHRRLVGAAILSLLPLALGFTCDTPAPCAAEGKTFLGCGSPDFEVTLMDKLGCAEIKEFGYCGEKLGTLAAFFKTPPIRGFEAMTEVAFGGT